MKVIIELLKTLMEVIKLVLTIKGDKRQQPSTCIVINIDAGATVNITYPSEA